MANTEFEIYSAREVHESVANASNDGRAFITANTVESNVDDLMRKHIIPVFVKDNEPLISHAEFIETVVDVTKEMFRGELISTPAVRVFHPIKGRISEAKDKPAHLLEEWEKTVYFERMAFITEIPSIQDNVGENLLSLTVGGVKSYSQNNLYNRKGTDQHFKIFVGFQNKVCTNCVYGLMDCSQNSR